MFTSDSSRQKDVCGLISAMCCFMYKDTYPADATYQHQYFDDKYFEGTRQQQGELCLCVILLYISEHSSYKNT